MISRTMVGLLILSTLRVTACAAPVDGVANDEDDVTRSRKVAGYDFAGPKVTAALPKNTACAQNADPVTDACIAARGETAYTKGCGVLCSVPVAERGKVAGFDLAGFRSDNELPAGMACAQNADAVTDACIEAHGKTAYTKGCGVLCSLPVAARGKVAGFDLTGYRAADALEANMACAQGADAVTDACIAKRGRTTYAKGCDVLCSVPVAR